MIIEHQNIVIGGSYSCSCGWAPDSTAKTMLDELRAVFRHIELMQQRRPQREVLYLAGPMTGIPEYNRPEFNARAKELEDAGYRVLNPARQPEGLAYGEYMRRGVTDILNADGVALLDGWAESKGARLERSVAIAFEIPARHWTTWAAPEMP